LLDLNNDNLGIIVHDRETKQSKCLSIPSDGFKIEDRFHDQKMKCYLHNDGQTLIVFQEKYGKKFILLDNPLC